MSKAMIAALKTAEVEDGVIRMSNQFRDMIVSELETLERGSFSGWIDAGERQPDATGFYLAWHNNPHFGRPFCGITAFDTEKGSWWSYVADQPVKHITHWMPLPEPPEVSENG
ncbi:MAG: DUF551 domain-containing protein [Bacteroidales bacterium]|nr:DUF551 domain-containing protein [Bacteroidales bacterium]